jgi:5-methylcytosine-specific restriction protein A
MPRKPRKPCSCPGCPNLTDSRYCVDHRSLDLEYASGSRNSFYVSSEWRKARKAYLEEHPLCAWCGQPAKIVDHIAPIRTGGALLDERNFQSLCVGCHTRKSIKEGSRYGRKVYTY